MPAFKFRMEFLIQARRRREEEAMARLAQRRASIRDLLKEIEETEGRKAALLAELEQIIRGGSPDKSSSRQTPVESDRGFGGSLPRLGRSGRINISLLKLYKEYDFKLAKDLARLNEFLRLSRREEAKEQAALTQASIDRKIIEKLKEKKKSVASRTSRVN